MSTWWKTFIGTIVCAIIVSIVWGYFDKANAYTVCSGASTTQPATGDTSCAPITAKHAHARFTHHKMGNDKGKMLPKSLRQMLNHKYGSKTPARRFNLGDFWNHPFGANSCWFGGKDPWDCIHLMGSKIGRLLIKEMNHTKRAIIHCAGEGIIGKYAYKVFSSGVEETEAGWYGVAAYTTACTIGRIWDKWWP